jgi:hypothetical protein
MVRLRAERIGRKPHFNWQCTLSDAVIDGLPDWIELGILYGVSTFTLGNLIEYSGLPESSRHVAKLDRDPLLAACAIISSVSRRAREAGVKLTIQPGILEGINQKLRATGINESFTASAA